jgi:hypothetical protein
LPRLAVGVLAGLCAAKLLLHLFTSVRHYGYFRDELYYLDMARHLDWGYVDCAPLIAVYAKIALGMGGSLAALRILPALAGAALVALTMLIARELGGGRYAQLLAGVAILLCPAILMTDSLLTMNAFEPLFWMGWETWLARPGLTWVKAAYPALMLAAGALLAPLSIPVLSPETYIRYTRAIGLEQPAIETHQLGPLPQIFADEFGWPEMVATVAGVYNSLPVDVRRSTAIFAPNYGEAGAIDLFGLRYGLPAALSGHQSYFLWGPRGYSGDSMIVMDGFGRRERLDQVFASVEEVARVDHPYSMPYNRFDVYYCHGIKRPLGELWPELKKWE